MDRYRKLLALLFLATCVVCGSGCNHSRWALRDPDYAQHYPQQAEEPLAVAKQALDARHVVGKAGTFVGGGGSGISPAGMAELGMFGYGRHWFEYNGSVVGMYHEEETDIYLGLAGGMRFQAPSRLAPFVGIGGFAGLVRTQTVFEMIFEDDDDEDFHDHDDCGCEDDDWNRLNPMFTVYPEIGTHFWLDSDTRLTTSLSYHISTEGRDSDMLMFSIEWGKLDLPRLSRASDHYGLAHHDVETAPPLEDEGPTLARLPALSETRDFSQAIPSSTVPGIYQLTEPAPPSEYR